MKPIIFCLMLAGCSTTKPLIDVCVSKPDTLGAHCIDKADAFYFLSYSKTDKFIMLSPKDAELLLNSCGNGDPKAAGVRSPLRTFLGVDSSPMDAEKQSTPKRDTTPALGVTNPMNR